MLCLGESLRGFCVDMFVLRVLFCFSHMIYPVLFSIESGRELQHYIGSMPSQFLVPCQYLLLVSSSLFRKCWTRVAPIVFLKAVNSAPFSSLRPPLISRAMFLLYPHFAMIFESDADYIFVTRLLVKKVCPSGYSTFGRYNPWYNIAASFHVTPTINIASDFSIAFFREPGFFSGFWSLLIHSNVLDSFLLHPFFSDLNVFSFLFFNVMTKSMIFLIDGTLCLSKS